MKKHYFPFLLALVLLWVSCKPDKNDPEDICANPPTAAFAADTTSGDAPLTVTFVNNAVGASAYLWTFKSGATATSASPVFTFSTAASYPVTLVVTSNTGCKDTFMMNTIIATVSGTAINIAAQEPDMDGFVVEGSGSIDTSLTPMVMTLSYTVTDTNGIPISDVCTNSMFVKL